MVGLVRTLRIQRNQRLQRDFRVLGMVGMERA